MVKWDSKKMGDLLLLANGLVLVVLINLLASHYFFRIDLTQEKRYSIKEPTRAMLRNLEDKVYVEVFLEGELNAGFRRFRKAIQETLEEFNIYSGNKIQYIFTDPTTAKSQQAQQEYMDELARKGITPTNVVERKDGQTAAKLVFPGALISYGGFETGVMLLKGSRVNGSEEGINQSIEGIEYELANAIYKLSNTDRKRIGFVTGHGELDSLQIAAFNNALLEQFNVFKVDLDRKRSLDQYDALIIAKPTQPFSEPDKYKLDQFIMNGGKVLLMLDKVVAEMDSVSDENYLALPLDLNLDDQLFKYGLRVNYDLVKDRNAVLYPIVTGVVNGKPDMQKLEWPFFPLINHYADHPATRNLDAVLMRFVSTIDTVKAVGIKKTPIMITSGESHAAAAPVNVSVKEVITHAGEVHEGTGLPVAYMLEGTFPSLYKNRFLPEGANAADFKEQSVPTCIVVIGDGDVARNDVNPRNGQPQPLGYDHFSGYTFANQDLLMNVITYLVNGDGLISARTKEVKIRPLNREKIRTERTMWQIINLGVPLAVLILYGVLRAVMRKRKFAQF